MPSPIRVLALAAAVAAGGLAGCSAAGPRWQVLAPTALLAAPAPASVDVAAIVPPGGGWPWVLGGQTKTVDLPDVGFWHSGDGHTWTPGAGARIVR